MLTSKFIRTSFQQLFSTHTIAISLLVSHKVLILKLCSDWFSRTELSYEIHRCHGVVVRAPASQSVDLGPIPLSSHTKD